MAQGAEAAESTVDVAAVERAAERIRGSVRRTPILAAGEISRRFGSRVVLKAENLQRAGSFKIRGATHKLARLSREELEAGVIAASAGNHAQALAVAAREHGTRAKLMMPAEAPLAKVEAVRAYGGEVQLVEGGFDEAMAAAEADAARTGRTLVHAFDDPAVIAGQGTVGLEIAEQEPETRTIVIALGGGALAAGTAIALRSRLGEVRVIGVQAETFAPYAVAAEESAARATPAGGGPGGAGMGARVAGTICDGIAIKRPGEITAPLVARHLDEVVTVGDDEVAEAMVLLLERSKLVVEGAGAAPVAALLAGKVQPPAEGATCVVLSGGNVDAGRLADCIRLGETAAGRRLAFATVVPDRPGALAKLLATVAEQGANVIDVAHIREGVDLHVRETGIRLVLGTDGADHGARVLDAVRAHGFEVVREVRAR